MSFRVWFDRLKQVTIGVFSSHPESQIEGLTLLDLRADRALDHDQIRTVLAEAITQVRAAGEAYPELVVDHLRRVVALDTTLETASPFAQALNTGFRVSDRRDPSRFAAKLIWAATYIRVMRNRPWWRRFGYSHQASTVADEIASRFLQRLSGLDESNGSWSAKA